MNADSILYLPRPLILVNLQPAARDIGAGQCDCGGACASMVTAATSLAGTAVQSLPLHSDTGGVLEVALGDDFSAVHSSRVQNGMVVLNRHALGIWRFFDQPTSLENLPSTWYRRWGQETITSTLDQMISVGLLISEGTRPTLVEQPQTLAAWLHITDRCNLRCDYCYLPHNHADMPPEVGRAAIVATVRSARRHGYQEIKLKYAGGEPLLLFPQIVGLHRYAAKLAERHGLGLKSLILSNGTLLTTQMVETMLELGIHLAISLDGIGPHHDCQRHYANGNGSFADVARAVDLALSCGLIPYITITVSGRNASGLPELIAWVLERDLPFSFNFYRENDFSVSHADLELEEQHIIEGMLAAYKVIEANLPRRSLLTSLADRANLAVPHLRTCSVGHGYLVFDHLGRVAKCQMDIGHIVTDIDDTDPLAAVRESTIGIRNPKVGEKAECRDCLWRHWCAGGCPLVAYRATGRYDAKSPNCGIYRALYPEIVRLEGLRFLKYADEVEAL